MLVKYLESFKALKSKEINTLVKSEISSIRLVSDIASDNENPIGSLFLYRDNAPSLFIPFSTLEWRIHYLDKMISASGLDKGIDLSTFMAVEMSEYETLVKAITSGITSSPFDGHVSSMAIANAITYNDIAFLRLTKEISYR